MIKNIIFDLGNVLVKVDLGKFKRNILSEGVGADTYDRFLKSDDFYRLIFKYETGSISTKYFIDTCLRKLDKKISRKKFIEHFNGMLVEKPEMRKFIEKITENGDYRFLLLSNTNPLHWKMRTRFPYILRLKNFCLSYKINLYKPDIRVFKFVLKKYKYNPSETLYIDDRSENCMSASYAGFNTISYRSFGQFKKEFRKFTNHKFNKSWQ